MANRCVTLRFSEDELYALLLGLLTLGDTQPETDFSEAISSARQIIEQALPEPLIEAPPASPADSVGRAASTVELIREAMRAERTLAIHYCDREGKTSRRTIAPIELDGGTLVAWCEHRCDFRHFRLDRIQSLQWTGIRYPTRHRVLMLQLELMRDDDGF